MATEKPEKFDLSSMDIADEKRKRLKQIVPEAFTEIKDDDGKVIEALDFERLKSALEEVSDVSEQPKERYGMTWPDKNKYQKIIQSSSIATLKPDRSESVNFDETDNLFIEGDNLEVLKLLQKSYSGQVKMIYIDPPYNTGNDFIYPDDYSETLETYLKYTGQIDEEGRKFSTNKADSGRFHTRWLNMMYPRLYIAQNLLCEDGVVFVSIDDNEVHNLRLVMDEILGEENFIGCVIWNSTKSVTNTALVSVSHTYNLIYAKEIGHFIQNRHELRLPETEEGFSNPDDDPRGPWKADPFQVGGERPNQMYEIVNPTTGKAYKPNPGCSWKNELKVFQQLLADNRIVFGRTGKSGPQRKRFLSEAKERGRVAKTLWTDLDTTANATGKLKDLMGGDYFTNPKPSDLISRFCQLSTGISGDGIILDFFAGSCTTAHAVLDLNKEDSGNRKFICVQMPEPCEEKSEARKAGYQTIADIGKERIRRVIKSNERKNQNAPGFKVFKLDRSNFKVWNNAPEDSEEAVKEQLKLHVDHINPDATQEDILYELLLKAGFPLTVDIEKKEMAGKTVFSIEDGVLLICLEKTLTSEVIRAMAEADPMQVICLDEGFAGNDQLKTNAVQTFKSRTTGDEAHQQIVFRTV